MHDDPFWCGNRYINFDHLVSKMGSYLAHKRITEVIFLTAYIMACLGKCLRFTSPRVLGNRVRL